MQRAVGAPAETVAPLRRAALQIVCGAPNARAGLVSALARVGAVLPNDVHIGGRQAARCGVAGHAVLGARARTR